MVSEAGSLQMIYVKPTRKYSTRPNMDDTLRESLMGWNMKGMNYIKLGGIMADKIDRLLTGYFTGGLDILIKQRERDLRNPEKEADLNSDIRSSNSYSNVVERILMKLEYDEQMNTLKDIRDRIGVLVDMFDDQHKQVYFARYRNKLSWESIQWTYHIDKRTGQRWCNELKDLIKEHNVVER